MKYYIFYYYVLHVNKTVTLSVKIDEDFHTALIKYAAKNYGGNKSMVVKLAIEEFITQEEASDTRIDNIEKEVDQLIKDLAMLKTTMEGIVIKLQEKLS